MPSALQDKPGNAAIHDRLRSVRGLLRIYVIAQGLLLVILWILLLFWLGGLIDYLPVQAGASESPRWLRVAILIGMVGGSLFLLGRFLVSRLLTSVSDRALAVLIERRYPQLNNELITAVELGDRSGDDVSNPAAHREMLDRVRADAARKMSLVEPAELFNWQPLWAAGLATCFGLVVTLITAVGMPGWFNHWSARLWTLSSEPWPRTAALKADGVELQYPAFTGQFTAERITLPFEESLVRVPLGASLRLQISADKRAPRVPEVCTLFYRSADGARGRANLRRIGAPRDGWQQFALDGPPLDSLTSDMILDIVGLDARLNDLQIEVVEPAVVSEMNLHCEYPNYLLDSFSTRSAAETIPYRSGTAIPEGTHVSLKGTASNELSRVEYVVRSDSGQTGSAELNIQRVEATGSQFTIPLGQLTASQVVEMRLIDEYGLSADQIPRYVITIREDGAPEVASRLEGIGNAVTTVAQLPIRGKVSDDYGIASVEAEVTVGEAEPISVPLQLDSDQEIRSTLDLARMVERQTIALEPDQILALVVAAQDFYDLDDRGHVGRGPSVQLAVVTEDKLLVILDRQELELRQRLEVIISELEQVREVLNSLSNQLTPAASASLPRGSIQRRLVSFQEEATPSDDDIARAKQLASLRAQQSVLQGDKSQQELVSVAARVDNLRMQLVNNRIDSYDRQERLKTKVHEPLRALLADDYDRLQRQLLALQTATQSGGGSEQAVQATTALDAVLNQLNAIKDNMLDIESFNEIIDLVRTLLDEQETLLNETEQQQKQRILDILR